MPHLSVSADAFAALWARRQPGEETEEAILRRLLGLAPDAAPGGGAATAADGGGDFIDATYGVGFAEGFEIFRTYKGRAHAARVESGRWRLSSDGRAYDSLNQLSQAVIDGNENAWAFWFYRGPDGDKIRIADLRDPALVQKRPRRKPRAPISRQAPRATAAPTANDVSPPAGSAGKPWEPPQGMA